MSERQPIAAILAKRGVSKTGLGKATGYARNHVSMVVNGRLPATPEFRRRCSQALGMPEAELFHPEAERTPRPAHRERMWPGDSDLIQLPTRQAAS